MAITRTVRQLIDGALRIAGAYEVGETPEPEDTATALLVLQDIIAEHSGGLFVPLVISEAITLVINQEAYTVGEQGSPDLNTQRPEQITQAYVRVSNYDHPVRIIGKRAFERIPLKTQPGRPTVLWYNPTVPNGTVNVWQSPNATDSLYIVSIKMLAEPTALGQNLLDTVGIARNYHNPLKWMLGEDLCEEYGKPVTPLILKRSLEGKASIISLNAARSVQASGFDFVTPYGRNDDLIRY
ncbi:hypothetical protein LCGC14_2326770 [marine sediment metagenome]|uniref:Uncharacterized protein n=1 Tax=marine sediment metagenome TaxID=412755 RepID=A0A0F9ETN9_9ZZZZ